MSERKSCFVISPIGEPNSDTRRRADQVLTYVIQPAVEECGYTATRADQIGNPGIITSQVIQRVIDDDLVVADLTEGNPNVFYELAIRHVAKKPIVQIMEKDEGIPFDVSDVRTVILDHRNLDSVAQAKDKIIEQIRSLESNPEDMETPVSISVGLKELSRSGGLEKHLPTLFGFLTKSLSDSSEAVRELVQSTIDLNDDTRKHLRRIDARPRGLLASVQGEMQTRQHNSRDKDE